MGIIGVVAALTLPAVIANYQTQQRITQLKKAYNILSQAYEMGVSENSGNRNIDTWENIINIDPEKWSDEHIDYIATLMQYTKPIRVCHVSDRNCVNKDYVAEDLGFDTSVDSIYILQDGMIIGRAGDNTPDYGIIQVDINGTKSPNKRGEDIFLLYIGYYFAGDRALDGVSFDPTDSWDNDANIDCIKNGYLGNCGKWAITYNNMDYLKCRDKLKADGSVHSCKDAK